MILQDHKRLAMTVGILLFTASTVAGIWHFRRDPQQAKVQELTRQYRELTSETSRQLPPEERRTAWQAFGQEVQKLTPHQRQILFAERIKERQEAMKTYASLTKEDQIAWLDREINRRQEARQRREQSSINRPANANESAATSSPQASASAAYRMLMRKLFLDDTTPEYRAQRAEYQKQMNERRQQRGLPPVGR